MKTPLLALCVIQLALVFGSQTVLAQDQVTPAATEAEKEAFYARSIEYRVADILKALSLADATKSNAVHDALVTQYHDLRVRDAAIDTRLKVDGKEVLCQPRRTTGSAIQVVARRLCRQSRRQPHARSGRANQRFDDLQQGQGDL
jgi:hypothetical protein